MTDKTGNRGIGDNLIKSPTNADHKLIYEYNDERYDYRSRVEFPEEYIYPYMKSLIYVI